MFTPSILVHLHNNPFVVWRTWMSKLGPNLALWQFFWKMVIPNYGFGVYFGLAILFMCHPNSLFAMGCLSPNPHASLYSNCLSGAKASDIKLWFSCKIKVMVSMDPYWKPNALMVKHTSMYNCIFTIFHLMKLFYPKFAFVWTLYVFERTFYMYWLEFHVE